MAGPPTHKTILTSHPQFGDTEAFGFYPDYRRQLTKFASVQDRLREWVPDVLERLMTFSCLTIQMLDIDGYRYDKATQVTVDAEGQFSAKMRECAREVNKTNFFIPGEITGGNTFGAVYVGKFSKKRNEGFVQYLTDIYRSRSSTEPVLGQHRTGCQHDQREGRRARHLHPRRRPERLGQCSLSLLHLP